MWVSRATPGLERGTISPKAHAPRWSCVTDPFCAMVGRRGSQPADHTPFRSWRLPDLFFLSGFSDGRDRLGPRRPPPAGVRAPYRAIAPCSAREAVALQGHPLYLWVSRRGLDPVQSVVCPHPRSITLHCPPPEGAGGGAERRAVGSV